MRVKVTLNECPVTFSRHSEYEISSTNRYGLQDYKSNKGEPSAPLSINFIFFILSRDTFMGSAGPFLTILRPAGFPGAASREVDLRSKLKSLRVFS